MITPVFHPSGPNANVTTAPTIKVAQSPLFKEEVKQVATGNSKLEKATEIITNPGDWIKDQANKVTTGITLPTVTTKIKLDPIIIGFGLLIALMFFKTRRHG